MIPTWAERCEKFGNKIVTNAMIQQAMQEEIDELRSKMDKMQYGIVSLTDDLFAERRECLKLEKELALQKLSDIGQAIEFNEDTESYVVGQVIEKEPVGMILEKGCAERGCACYDVRVDEGVEVKTVRELTDEEIKKVWSNLKCSRSDALELIYARAIMAKACNLK